MSGEGYITRIAEGSRENEGEELDKASPDLSFKMFSYTVEQSHGEALKEEGGSRISLL